MKNELNQIIGLLRKNNIYTGGGFIVALVALVISLMAISL